MRCQEIMHRRVCTVRESDDLAFVARTMREENIGFVPVLDDGGALTGALTDRDMIVRAFVSTADPRRMLVREIMSRDVVVCRPTDSVEVAERKMREHRITRLVIVESDGAVAGIISLSDIAQYDPPGRVGRTLQAIAERKYSF
jgi:CBS domain-containing protein